MLRSVLFKKAPIKGNLTQIFFGLFTEIVSHGLFLNLNSISLVEVEHGSIDLETIRKKLS